MNSIDERSRNKRDVAELLKIADEATNGYFGYEPSEPTYGDTTPAQNLRARYEAIVARRAAEDAGEVVK